MTAKLSFPAGDRIVLDFQDAGKVAITSVRDAGNQFLVTREKGDVPVTKADAATTLTPEDILF